MHIQSRWTVVFLLLAAAAFAIVATGNSLTGWAWAAGGLCLVLAFLSLGQTPSQTWFVNCNFPLALQFGAYIGQQEDFKANEAAVSKNEAETEWRRQYELWLKKPSGEQVDQQAQPTILDAPVDPRPFGFDPPNFDDLHQTPHLQKLCRQHWPAFHQMWGVTSGRKLQLAAQLNDSLQQMRLDKLMRKIPHKRPFQLQIDFVLWPEDTFRELTDDHLILGIRFLQPTERAALQQIIIDQVKKVVVAYE